MRIKPGNISRRVWDRSALSMQEKEEEDAHCGINKGSILFLKGLAVK